jgi:hypothetical protein
MITSTHPAESAPRRVARPRRKVARETLRTVHVDCRATMVIKANPEDAAAILREQFSADGTLEVQTAEGITLLLKLR